MRQAHLMAGALRRPASAQLPEAFREAARRAWAASAPSVHSAGDTAERSGMLADVADSLSRLGLAATRGRVATGGALKMDICLEATDRCGRQVRARRGTCAPLKRSLVALLDPYRVFATYHGHL